jgi:DNA repair protein RadC
MEKPRQTPPTLRFRLRTVTVAKLASATPVITAFGPEAMIPYLAAIFADLDANKEHIVAVALNARLRVVGYHVVSTGIINASIATPRDVLVPMLRLDAVSFVLSHNHPSNEVEPSDNDLELTAAMAEAARIVSLPLVDHIIIGEVDGDRLPRWHSIRRNSLNW